MADVILERIYTIPLRKEWTKVASYKRTAKAITAIKEFIAKHMKVTNRDLNLVKIDSYFNNEVWARGSSSPPARVTVKARKEGEKVIVTFVEIPKHLTYAQARHTKFHQKVSKATVTPKENATEVKTEEDKKAETEKGQSVAEANEKIAEAQAKNQKHAPRDKRAQKAPLHRVALQK